VGEVIAEAGQTLVKLGVEQGDAVKSSVIEKPETGDAYMGATAGAEIRTTHPVNGENLKIFDSMFSRRWAATR
jgi:hypothetical protein